MTDIARTLTMADMVTGLTGVDVPRDSAYQVAKCDVVIDSRLATQGCLFVALRGEHQDGHSYIANAIDGGAIAIIAEQVPAEGTWTVLDTEQLPRDWNWQDLNTPLCLKVPDSLAALQRTAAYWRRQIEVRILGITGSIGKTTSKELIASVISQRYRTLKSEGNYNNEIGLPLTLLHLSTLYERAVLEMGMYDLGEIALLAEIARPQIGVVTNVGPSHLERLGSIERIAQAKAELPSALPSAQDGGIAILNADDERVLAMANLTKARVFTYGLTQDADLWADEIVSEGLDGIRFRFHYGQEVIYARVPMLGRHSVHTALCAAAVGLVEGLSWEEIMAGLRDLSAQLRLVAVPGPNGSTILDDTYNASPTSSIAALNLLAEIDGRKIGVLGDMYELGQYEEESHKLVGRRAREVVDILVTVGSLGRIIGEEAIKGGMDTSAVYAVETNAQAVELLRRLIQPSQEGDKILVKGSRGMEMEEIVNELYLGAVS